MNIYFNFTLQYLEKKKLLMNTIWFFTVQQILQCLILNTGHTPILHWIRTTKHNLLWFNTLTVIKRKLTKDINTRCIKQWIYTICNEINNLRNTLEPHSLSASVVLLVFTKQVNCTNNTNDLEIRNWNDYMLYFVSMIFSFTSTLLNYKGSKTHHASILYLVIQYVAR